MKRGEQFRKIFTLLAQGKEAGEIIAMGFPKSSVYWAIAKMKAGKEPERGEYEDQPWLRSLRKIGLVHDCEDGRVRVLREDEILTDEGVVFQKVCPRCNTVVEERFVRWTPSSKERYLLQKERRLR